ncbi:MAG: SDR family oxidoreductase [Geminicoccaceae bacterium]|nr:SDR family oxidoreductase [Geminicoccaceae bacterium]MCS7269073.1 SDR family oxidoreductase [Geminicoccaceae bacterium]MDW8125818.1 SDR family oxidoreductase [Geminicoccaceae bacterium]MDW8342706.1 SDR family oxidoreductase [Geminicoccaceae bacterium]
MEKRVRGGTTLILFCFGFGYVAHHLARRLRERGIEIRGTTRSAEKARALDSQGVRGFLFARDRPVPPAALAGTTHVLVSIPPDEEGDPVLDRHGEDLRRLEGLVWVGYLGTTGVYGDRGGAWVDEDTPLQPTLARTDRRARAEAAWLASGLPVHVFRLAGIYGPGRNAIRQLLDGTARRIVKPGQVFSRVHVEDIAAVLEASMERPNPGRIYNVCDDEPAPPQDVVAFAAELLGVPPPPEEPFETAELSPVARSFYRDNRRVRNERIKRELGIALRYPTYREGLRALLPIETRGRG